MAPEHSLSSRIAAAIRQRLWRRDSIAEPFGPAIKDLLGTPPSYRLGAAIANMAPCGSVQCAIQLPPGT